MIKDAIRIQKRKEKRTAETKSCKPILGLRQNAYNAFYFQSINSVLVLSLNMTRTVLEMPRVAQRKPKKYTVPSNVVKITNKTLATLNYRTAIVSKILAFRGERSQLRERKKRHTQIDYCYVQVIISITEICFFVVDTV